MTKADRQKLRAARRRANKKGRQLWLVTHVLRRLDGDASSLSRKKYYYSVDWKYADPSYRPLP